MYRSLRQDAPVWRVPGTRTWLVTTWALVSEANSRSDDFSSNLTALLVSGPDGEPVEFDLTSLGTAIDVLATADDPSHAAHRRLVFPHLVPGRVQGLQAELEELALDPLVEWRRRRRDRVDGRGGRPPPAHGRRQDHRSSAGGCADAAAVGVRGDRAALGRRLLRADGVPERRRPRPWAGTSAARFDEARRVPGPTLLGDLARAANDGTVSDHEAVAMLVQLVGAGGESTAGLIGNAARILAEQPELQVQLRTDADLIPAFLEEVLRVESPFRGHYRLVRRSCRLGEAELLEGDHLVLHWGAANRDAVEFAEADRIILGRPRLSQPSGVRTGPPLLRRRAAGPARGPDRHRDAARTDPLVRGRPRRRTGMGSEHLRPPARFVAFAARSGVGRGMALPLPEGGVIAREGS